MLVYAMRNPLSNQSKHSTHSSIDSIKVASQTRSHCLSELTTGKLLTQAHSVHACKIESSLTSPPPQLARQLSACAWHSAPKGPHCKGRLPPPGHRQDWLPQETHTLPLRPHTSSNTHNKADTLQERRRRPGVCDQCLPADNVMANMIK